MNKISIIALTSAAALSIAACSDISTNDRYIEMDEILPQRTIIIEDFTGQNCTNCPEAHEVLEKISEQYPDNVIPVSIHAGEFALAVEDGEYPDYIYLKQPEGDVYNAMWSINAWPKGVVNRRGGAVDSDKWAALARQELVRLAPATISVSATYDADTENISINTAVEASSDVKAKLQLWILESGIVAEQIGKDGAIDGYVHNNVFRAAVNGTWGEDVSIAADSEALYTHSIARRHVIVEDKYLVEDWNVGNLTVVAFLYDGSGVLQAARCDVK